MSIEARAEKLPVVNAKTGEVKMATKLTLIENILEINGEQAEQSIAMQQVFEISDDKVTKQIPMPCSAAAAAAHRAAAKASTHRHHRHHHSHHHKHNNRPCGLAAMSSWATQQSVPVKIAMSSLFGVFVSLVVLMFAKLVAMMVMARRRRQQQQPMHADYAFVESYVAEDSHLMTKEDLPA
jgi:hypothetical protein